ncbi:HicB-like antitoxin [Mycobacterium phage IdentityCrisis]|uniref:HicB-like antitoxin n=1 Tax=Mycobacterium phage IdentityCrisis TaxID=2599866 RepID=A0A5J6TMW0_9CAUD|nr:HicB-like antitoxin [Mycobacterium phage IdentityCrisis]QFG10052.1 HicB-like antitoxin [Mycobacterium phage IdentityCrisis]
MHTYKVNVTRDDRWWMITVPELDGYVNKAGAINLSDTTQARRLSEVRGQAIDFICTVTDSAPSEVEVNISIEVDGIDVSAQARHIEQERTLAECHASIARHDAMQLARELADRGVAVRDVGEVLGLSFQRAQQLISAAGGASVGMD